MRFLRWLVARLDVAITRWQMRRDKCTCAICCDQYEHTRR